MKAVVGRTYEVTNMKERAFRCNECGLHVDVAEAEFNYCPRCGALAPHWQALCGALLSLYERDGRILDAVRLYRKAAYPDAARSALISIETELKRLGKTQSYGTHLVDEVLAFEYDHNAKKYLREPAIKINKLKTNTDRNEQDGIRLLINGLFKGLRNTLMHQHVRLSPIDALSIVVMSNLMIHILNNGSILNERVCIWRKVKKPNHTRIAHPRRVRKRSR